MVQKKAMTTYLLVFLILGVIAYSTLHNNTQGIPQSEILGQTTTSPTIEVTASASVVTPEVTVLNEPTTSKIISTPSVVPQKVLQATVISPQKPSVISAKAGSISELLFSSLSAKTLYKIDLSSYSAKIFTLRWPKNTQLKWASNQVPQSELLNVPVDDDEMVGETVQYSGLLDIPSTKYIYLYSESSITNLKVSIIDPSDNVGNFSTQATGIYNSNSGASYTSLSIVTRDQWGANPVSWDKSSGADIDDASRLVWYPVYYKAARIILHHTATTLNTSNPASSVRAIYLYHAYTRGWGDIGYNYLVDQNGTIYEGKGGGDETQGYHAFGSANRISIGISVIGDYTNAPPTGKAKAALINLMAEKAAFYGFTLKYSDGGTAKWRDPSYTVFGHRSSYQWNSGSNTWTSEATACPGNAFMPILSSLIKEAETYRVKNFSALKQMATEVDQSFAQSHEIGTLVVRYRVPDSTPESVIQTYIPLYSGIASHTIIGNTVTYKVESNVITHPNGDTEYVVPPMHWTGYDNEYMTFSKPFELNGPEDRTKTLLKIFRMDPRVEAADLRNYMTTQ